MRQSNSSKSTAKRSGTKQATSTRTRNTKYEYGEDYNTTSNATRSSKSNTRSTSKKGCSSTKRSSSRKSACGK